MERPVPLDAELVREFVGAAHVDLVQVKKMLAAQPALVNATWDWGEGDWESALGGAAHMGEREIALYLLSQGARLDLYAAAMLGELDVVRAILSSFPESLHTPGPHGIPLLTHAQAGGDAAAPVVAFLGSLLQGKEV